MTFVRTVHGDVDPADLGITYAHEHLVIDGGRPVELSPDFLLADVDRMVEEVSEAVAAGLRSVVDAMPIDAGRNVVKLAEISRRCGIHVVASTGLHHARFYPDDHWSVRATEADLVDRFTSEVIEGIDGGPHRAGVIKIAGSEGGLSQRDERIFSAAALTQRRTGVPILTHCEDGTGALEQVRFLVDRGAEPGHVALSHVDKVVDRGYHRELLASGAYAEYDQSFRWRDGPNGTLTLLRWMVEDGFADRIVIGMDAARQGYLRTFGGAPGLLFLLREFSDQMAAIGLGPEVREALFVQNPARAFAFAASASDGGDGGTG
jgi:predicted metal-dependent phosphotriesterase family hydrolase